MPDLESLSGGVIRRLPSSAYWELLRDARQAALKDSPDEFMATLEEEILFEEPIWRDEFDRGTWYVGRQAGEPITLIGATWHPEIPEDERYIEYVWVASDYRGKGIGSGMLRGLLDELRNSGVPRVHLWVLDDNDFAKQLYGRLGFYGPNKILPLEKDPMHSEERLTKELG